MNIDSYLEKSSVLKELELKQKFFIKTLLDIVNICDLDSLLFFKYKEDTDSYFYNIGVDKEDFIEDDIDIEDYKHEIIIKDKIIYGKILIKKECNKINSYLINSVINAVKEKYLIEEELIKKNKLIDFYLITEIKDNSYEFFKNYLETNFNINIFEISSIKDIEEILKSKQNKTIIGFYLDSGDILKKEEELIKKYNEFFVAVGPEDFDLAVLSGNLNIDKYFNKDNLDKFIFKKTLINFSSSIPNKNNQNLKIISITGISGGVGCSSIAMNISNLISEKTNNNVLYIDLSTTKAVSNLFLSDNPLPIKNIIDLVKQKGTVDNEFENGLVEVSKNFHYVIGIQKHLDSEIIHSEDFIQNLINYIHKVSNRYNYIIIDLGEANASALPTNIFTISSEIWIITELILTHISKLKTFYDLLKRAGLKEKITIIANRYNSEISLSSTDIRSILTDNKEDLLNFKFKIENDFENVGIAFANCELVKNKSSIFLKNLYNILEKKNIIKIKEKKKNFFNFKWGKK